MTVKEIFQSMKKEAHEKSVPIPSYTEHLIQDRHRQILIEWLIEVATEERYRRYRKILEIFLKSLERLSIWQFQFWIAIFIKRQVFNAVIFKQLAQRHFY